MLGYYTQGITIVGEVKGQDKGRAKGQIHLISYNYASNCHRDFKLDSCFSLWKTASHMTLTLKSLPKVKIFETYQLRKTSQNILGYYAQGLIYSWRGQRSKPRLSKTSNSLIGYNFGSNCHRDFKLGSCFSLWKAVPNMTLTWTVRPRSKFWKHQLRKTSHNMFGYYAQGIIYCWRGQRSKSRSSKRSNSLGNFVSNCHRDFKLRSYFSSWKVAPNMDLDFWPWQVSQVQNFWNNNYGKLAKTCLDIMRTAQSIIGEALRSTSTVSLVSDAFDYCKHPLGELQSR